MRFGKALALYVVLLPLSVCGQTIEIKGGKQPSSTPAPSATLQPASPAAVQPAPVAATDVAYRPILLGQGPNSLVNRIDTASLIKNGQKDGLVMFNALVDKTGKMVVSAFYRASPNSNLLEQEVKRRLRDAVFVPGIYNHKPVDAVYYATVSFVVVEGKPRLRIFANQEYPELQKENDFVGPQPILGGESGFNGLHYPPAAAAQVPVNGIADIRVRLDDKGEIQLLSVVG